MGHVESHFSPFGDSVVSVQDRYTVCTKHTIASEIILDTPDELLGDVGQVASPFGPFRDSVSFGA
jgi:hypothetical protein